MVVGISHKQPIQKKSHNLIPVLPMLICKFAVGVNFGQWEGLAREIEPRCQW